jgi:uncharacterized membrane protein
MRRLPLCSLAFLVVTGCFPDHHPVQPPEDGLFDEFTPQTLIVDESAILTGLGGNLNGALALNQHGMIAGFSSSAADAVPVVWEGGSVRRLTSEGGGLPTGRATGVNNQRQAVGWVVSSSGERLPYSWSGATPRMLDTYGPGEFPGWAHDVNDAGQIVGAIDVVYAVEAVLWENAESFPFWLWPPCEIDHESEVEAEARAINERGQIVGVCRELWSGGGVGPREGVLWQAGSPSGQRLMHPDFEAEIEPQDINDLGLIAGFVWKLPESRAYAATWPAGADAPPEIIGPRDSRASGSTTSGRL